MNETTTRTRCKCCGRRLAEERQLQGLKTCGRRCSKRRRRWRIPEQHRIGQLLSAAERVVWNDQELQAKLGGSRAEVSARLLALARRDGWQVARDASGLVRCIGVVPPDRLSR